jgi:internalin A
MVEEQGNLTSEELLESIEQAAYEGVTELDLSGKGITALPESIGQLVNLQILDLSSNQLSSLPDSIKQLVNLQILSLSNNHLESLPESIGQLVNLQILSLGNNHLESLPNTIGQLINLESLYLQRNALRSLPNTIGQLVMLQTLDLDRNPLSSLPNTIGQLINLKSLYLMDNGLASLPGTIDQLINLERLYLYGNRLTSLPGTIDKLINLQILDLQRNALRSLPNTIGQLVKLQTLDLQRNALTSLPGTIDQLINLQTFNLNSNELTSLPGTIGQLVKLQTLNLYDNGLTSLPGTISQLVNLQTLNLNSNKLRSLPGTIDQLINLQTFNLNSNELTSLPGTIGQLVKLQTLNLYDNRLTSLPGTIGQLVSLQTLNLNSNKLRSLPETIGQLVNLQTLNLNSNELTSLPEMIGQLVNLQTLNLYDNRLTSLPGTIDQLVSLQTLNLNGNELTSLPETIGQLVKLQALYLDGNALKNLPLSLAYLQAIEDLNLLGNPLEPILESAYGAGIEELKAYLRSLENAKPLYEAKLILLGEGKVGKTTLLKALTGKKTRTGEPTTHGLQIAVAPLYLPHPMQDSKFQLNAWDFGGQEVYRVTHQFFFSPHAIYLLVWEPRMGVMQCQVEDWLKLIRLRVGEKARVIIVSTHSRTGGRIARIDRPAFQDAFGDMIVDFLEVDSMVKDPNTGEKVGITHLKSLIATTAATLDHMGQLFNNDWYTARKDLLTWGETRPLISYTTFSRMCVNHGLSEIATRTLAIMMHDLGYIVYYADDERLKVDVILQPEWLTKAIGFVLEDRATADKQGILPDDHLRAVWLDHEHKHEPRYEPHLYPFFLRLMEKYDVSYRLESGDASLVAQHVPQERPELPWQFNDEPPDNLRRIALVCVMDEAPTGLVPWMIVRTHEYTYEEDGHHLHWHTGMFLRNKTHGEAMLELRDREFHIHTQAVWPEYFMNVLQLTLEKLITDNWPGMAGNYSFRVPCRTQRNGKPCRGRFDIAALKEFLDQGYETFPCQECRTHQDIVELLYGFEDEDTRAQLASIEAKLDRGFEGVLQGLEELESRLANSVMAIMYALANEAQNGPRLFTIEPIDGWGVRNLYSRPFRLHLWCEAEGCQHPVYEDEMGIYEFRRTQKWIEQVAPYANFVAGMLKTILPVAIPAANLYFGKAVFEQSAWSGWLDLMKEGTDKLLPKISGSDPSREGMLSDAERAGILALHSFLREKDPNHKRLGLRRIPTYTGDYRWLCQAHYKASLSKIPDVIEWTD